MTTGDWDFDNANWVLDSSIYVSAPSSFREDWTAAAPKFFIKTTVVPIANVKEGRVITYLRFARASVADSVTIYLRYQDVNNHYKVLIYGNGTINVIRVKAGVSTTITTGSVTITPATWQNFRFTWWNDYVGLVVRVEHYEGGNWVKKVSPDAYDAENNWKDIGGRVGFRHVASAAFPTWMDDTYIYGVPP